MIDYNSILRSVYVFYNTTIDTQFGISISKRHLRSKLEMLSFYRFMNMFISIEDIKDKSETNKNKIIGYYKLRNSNNFYCSGKGSKKRLTTEMFSYFRFVNIQYMPLSYKKNL